MSNRQATAQWTKDTPSVDGVYWWRADSSDKHPDIHSDVQGRFYEIGESKSTTVENFGGEWLGPITPEEAGKPPYRPPTVFQKLVNERNALLAERDRLREALNGLGWHSQNGTNVCWCDVKSDGYAKHKPQCAAARAALRGER